jgi:hypothetical protein
MVRVLYAVVFLSGVITAALPREELRVALFGINPFLLLVDVLAETDL